VVGVRRLSSITRAPLAQRDGRAGPAFAGGAAGGERKRYDHHLYLPEKKAAMEALAREVASIVGQNGHAFAVATSRTPTARGGDWSDVQVG
jgi:hypothetical protein